MTIQRGYATRTMESRIRYEGDRGRGVLCSRRFLASSIRGRASRAFGGGCTCQGCNERIEPGEEAVATTTECQGGGESGTAFGSIRTLCPACAAKENAAGASLMKTLLVALLLLALMAVAGFALSS